MERNIIDGLGPVPEAAEGVASPQPAVLDHVSAPVSEVGGITGGAPHLLRLALAFEFLLALIAIPTAWSEIGGQGHLDLMPWYLKLVLIVAASWAFLRLSAALAAPGAARNRHFVVWLLVLLAITGAMGLVTYYYHLHEPDDQQGGDENPGTSISLPKSPGTGRFL